MSYIIAVYSGVQSPYEGVCPVILHWTKKQVDGALIVLSLDWHRIPD